MNKFIKILLPVLGIGMLVIVAKVLITDPDIVDCGYLFSDGARQIAQDREDRFLGKVTAGPAKCRGGEKALKYREAPWIDWGNYYATGDSSTLQNISMWFSDFFSPDSRGVNGALIDLEYQRIELLKFNLFNSLPVASHHDDGKVKTQWDEYRLSPLDPRYQQVGGDKQQQCWGELVRFRTDDGICNDINNPLMGASGQLFARNVQFSETFPILQANKVQQARHQDRLALLTPDPQVISRELFSRQQSDLTACNQGKGHSDRQLAHCDYKKAPFMNVLAAYWIQFMTHDWFSHLDKSARNDPKLIATGCQQQKVNNQDVKLAAEEIAKLGCRPADMMEQALIASKVENPNIEHPKKTTQNFNTAWWDASQLYGYDDISKQRVKRDPADRAKLLLSTQGQQAYLPLFNQCLASESHSEQSCQSDPMAPEWAGQEATGFADNWSIGMSFYHNVFAREHNAFVQAFRDNAIAFPKQDSGLRHPDRPTEVILNKNVSDDELFSAARLVVSAMIAKIHTIEWTTQLLYDEPLYKGMNSNWFGLFDKHPMVEKALSRAVDKLGQSDDPKHKIGLYSVLASGPGIVGTGANKSNWSMTKPEDINAGVNHFGSPFNFPEEFVTVYKLHSLLPDLIEYRQLQQPNAISSKIAVIDTFRGKATEQMRDKGIENWALSMGRQRLGLLTINNAPLFLQNLEMPQRLAHTPTKKLDVIALDILRDRERGVPRFNEFRRQYGLKQLRSFDDFIDWHLLHKENRSAAENAALAEQQQIVAKLRRVYGTHQCQASKIISYAQVDEQGTQGPDGKYYPNDCLGYPDGSIVDNIEDLDTYVGWHAESTRPHGYAISETQFQVFILNASRRLFSDRFFTSSLRPEFYTQLGYDWLHNNGPGEAQFEPELSNGHQVEVSPLKRVLLRTIPELKQELSTVINVFDPWARDRGDYYSVDWKPRADAKSDPAFH